MLGDHRRIFDHNFFPELDTETLHALRKFATYSLLFMLAFQPIWFYNVITSALWGPKAEKNPWKANTLEWTTDSPPPHGNWATLPTVYRGPYEYSSPDRAEDYWPQNAPS
jgi:cytochrome c oxidase subunit 1